MRPIIKVQNVSKKYRLGLRRRHYHTLRDTITSIIRNPLGRFNRNSEAPEDIWALSDITFDVNPGEVLGIVGRNGAGKSTLLKVLSQITEPTSGRIELYGRIGSLLEVGTGFHPELTGRENIFLNGAILGMHKAEIRKKFDAIVDFSELAKFLDTPVKHYSSGMYMRLAFAVAAHLDPEILIIDEVLAVGDAQFQKKCLGKMGDVAKEGRTVLFVSHNLTAVQGLCNRALWLESAKIMKEGRPEDVIAGYLGTSFSDLTEQFWPDINTAPGNETVRIHRARVRPLRGIASDSITVSTPLILEFEYWNSVPGTILNLSIVLVGPDGTLLFNSGPQREPVWNGKPFPAGLFRSCCYIPGNLLNDGAHRVQLYIIKDQSAAIFRYDDLLAFDVREEFETRKYWFGKWVGAVRPDLEWSTELLDPATYQYSTASGSKVEMM